MHDKTQIAALLAVALTAAVFFNGSHMWLFAVTLVVLLASFALAWWRAAKALPLTAVGMLLCAFWAWTGLGMLWSPVPYVTGLHFWLVGGMVLTYLCWMLLEQRGGTRGFEPALAVFGIVLTGAVFVQWLAGTRIDAPFINPNSNAAFLNLLWLPLAAVYLARPGQRTGVLALAAVALMVFATGLVGTRGAFVGGALALAFLASAAGWSRVAGRRALVTLALVWGAALGVADLLGRNRIATLADPVSAGMGRIRIWESTLEMIADKPFLGFGPGTFWLSYPQYRDAADTSAGYHVHNDLLQFWVEGGLPALLIVLTLMVIATIICIKCARAARATREPGHFTAVGVYTGLLATGVHGLFTFNLQLLPFLVVVGLYLARLEHAAGTPASVSLPVAKHASVFTRTLLTVTVVVSALHITTVGIAHVTLLKAEEKSEQMAYEEAEALFSRSLKFWSAPDITWHMRANMGRRALEQIPEQEHTIRAALFERVLFQLEEAERRNPLSAKTRAVRGRLYLHNPDVAGPGHFENAERELRAALLLNPRQSAARLALAELKMAAGDRDGAVSVLEDGLTQARHPDRALLQRALEAYRDDEGHEGPP